MDALENHIISEVSDIRLDKYLSDKMPELSRSYIQRLITAGAVSVNEKAVKSNYKLSYNDSIHVTVPEPENPDIIPENIPLDILYEDQRSPGDQQTKENGRSSCSGSLQRNLGKCNFVPL